MNRLIAASPLSRLTAYLILIAVLSVAGTYWMVATLRQAMQDDAPIAARIETQTNPAADPAAAPTPPI